MIHNLVETDTLVAHEVSFFLLWEGWGMLMIMINYLNRFSDATLAALTISWLGTHFTTRLGLGRIGE